MMHVPPCRCPWPYRSGFHQSSCPHYDSAHDPPGMLPPRPDSPFAPDAEDDPETPGRCRDAADDGCPACGEADCRHAFYSPDFGEPVPADCGYPADEYDTRPDDR